VKDNPSHERIFLTCDLAGGLGNQLFQLAALRVFSDKYQRNPVIELSRIGSGNSPRKYSIPDDLYRNLMACEPILRRRGPFKLLISKFVWNFESRILRSSLRNVYKPSSVGFDGWAGDTFEFRRLEGYFQTFRYPDELGWRKYLSEFQPQSKVFEKHLARMRLIDPVAIHIRGTDYLSKGSKIGNLDSLYFRKGLELGVTNDRNVWVFSDDIQYAEKILMGLDYNFEFIDPLREIGDIETMLLMSKASTLVISNSTFAWWAAYINSTGDIYAPKKWFKEMSDPEDLIPPNWRLLESTWSL
jgi:hypothetical protein